MAIRVGLAIVLLCVASVVRLVLQQMDERPKTPVQPSECVATEEIQCWPEPSVEDPHLLNGPVNKDSLAVDVGTRDGAPHAAVVR